MNLTVNHSQLFPLQNPSISQDQSIKGSLGYFTIGLISGVISPVVGVIAVPIQAIKWIWNSHQLYLVSNQKAQEGQELKKLNERKVGLENEFAQNKKKLIAAILALIPFLGIFAAGAYLKATSPEVRETGLRGGVEAIAQTIAGIKIFQFFFYIVRGMSKEKFIEVYAKRLLDRKYAKEDALTHFNEGPLAVFKALGKQDIQIPVNRGDGKKRFLSAFAIPNLMTHTFDPNLPVMVIFHPNGYTKEMMCDHAEFYKHVGFNVMAVTMGGYPGSGDDVTTSEISSYQDVHAVIQHLKAQGFTKVGVHGTSIGGSLACAAAELHPDVVKMVVADQTFGRARDVAANFLRNELRGMVPAALIRGLIGGAFPIGEVVPGVTGSDGQPYRTDGLDNIRKLKARQNCKNPGVEKCYIFAIQALRDTMMGRVKDLAAIAQDKRTYADKYAIWSKLLDQVNLSSEMRRQRDRLTKPENYNPVIFKENFSLDIVTSCCETLEGHIATLPEDHCSWFGKEQRHPIYFRDRSDGSKESVSFCRYELGGILDPLAKDLLKALNNVFFSEDKKDELP